MRLADGVCSVGPGSAPRNVQVRPLSSSTMVIQWDEPQEQNGLVTGYKVRGVTVLKKVKYIEGVTVIERAEEVELIIRENS